MSSHPKNPSQVIRVLSNLLNFQPADFYDFYDLDELTIELWTDGSCQYTDSKNGRGAGGWAYTIILPNNRIITNSGGHVKTTSARMELWAIAAGLTHIFREYSVPTPVVIYTDCQAFIDCMEAISDKQSKGFDTRQLIDEQFNQKAHLKDRDLYLKLGKMVGHRHLILRKVDKKHAWHMKTHHLAYAAAQEMNKKNGGKVSRRSLKFALRFSKWREHHWKSIIAAPNKFGSEENEPMKKTPSYSQVSTPLRALSDVAFNLGIRADTLSRWRTLGKVPPGQLIKNKVWYTTEEIAEIEKQISASTLVSPLSPQERKSMSVFKANLKRLREKAKLNQKQLANKLPEANQSLVSYWERGYKRPTPKQLQQICKVIGCSLVELVGDDEPVPVVDEVPPNDTNGKSAKSSIVIIDDEKQTPKSLLTTPNPKSEPELTPPKSTLSPTLFAVSEQMEQRFQELEAKKKQLEEELELTKLELEELAEDKQKLAEAITTLQKYS